MTRGLAAAIGTLFLAFGAFAQDSAGLQFEAASIRPAPADRRNGVGASGGPGTSDPTRVHYRFFTLHMLLMIAYDVFYYQVSGAAESEDRYDVEATLPSGMTKDQARAMLQNFLTDQFRLKLHRETKVLPLYELVAAKNGPKIQPHSNGSPRKSSGPNLDDGEIAVGVGKNSLHMFANKVTMKELTRVLSDDLATPVLDKTGLTGVYDFDFEYSRAGLGGFSQPADETDNTGAPNLVTAVQESLGLKLESKKGPIEMIVVDHAEKSPRGN